MVSFSSATAVRMYNLRIRLDWKAEHHWTSMLSQFISPSDTFMHACLLAYIVGLPMSSNLQVGSLEREVALLKSGVDNSSASAQVRTVPAS